MQIVSITEMKGEGSREGHWSATSGRSYQRKLRVLTDSFDMGPAQILKALGYVYGDLYSAGYAAGEFDYGCYLDSIDIEEEGEDGIGWIVTAHYGWYDVNNAGGGPDQNPLLMPIDVSWGLRDHETVLDTDQDGKACLNTAGDPYDPPMVIDDPRLLMTVVRNEPQFNVGLVAAYRNAVNSDPFAGFPALGCKVLNISAKSLWHQDVGWYYQATYEFEFLTSSIDYDSDSGFRKRVISQGFRAISTVNGKPYHITLKGTPINSPMLLDENGYLLTPNQDPYYQTFKGYPELPFSAFGFDPLAISGQRTGKNSLGGGGLG